MRHNFDDFLAGGYLFLPPSVSRRHRRRLSPIFRRLPPAVQIAQCYWVDAKCCALKVCRLRHHIPRARATPALSSTAATALTLVDAQIGAAGNTASPFALSWLNTIIFIMLFQQASISRMQFALCYLNYEAHYYEEPLFQIPTF